MIKKLYLSHQNYEWSAKDPINEAVFVDKKNINYYLKDNKAHESYSTVEDLELKLEEVDALILEIESIYCIGIDEKFFIGLTENILIYRNLIRALLEHPEKTHGLEWCSNLSKNIFMSLAQERLTEDPTLFLVGCSITHGTGVTNNERYGQILADRLNLPCVFLSMAGSSISWQADQLLRSDIRPGDVVVWGLTNLTRVSLARDYELENYTVSRYLELPKEKQYFNLDYFSSWSLLVSSVKQILQVENFCKKIGAKFYLANLLETEIIPTLYKNQLNYIDCLVPWLADAAQPFAWIDLGEDNVHPGPKQHEIFAEKIYQTIVSN